MPPEYEEFTIPITFSAGVDLKTEQKSVKEPRLRMLQNGVFAKGTTIVKRTGYDTLAKTLDNGDALPHGRALASRGDELLMFGEDGQLYSYRDASESWSMIGTAISIEHTERTVAKTSTHQTVADAATVSGIQVVAWEDSLGGVWVAIVDQAAQRILRLPAQLDAGGRTPRVVRVGGRIHVYWANVGSGQIRMVTVNPTSYATAYAATVLVADLTTPWNFDAQAAPEVVGVILAYDTATGYTLAYVDPSGVIGDPSFGQHLPAPASVALASRTGPIAVTWSANRKVGVALFDSSIPFPIVYKIIDDDLVTPIASGTAYTAPTGTQARITCAFDASDSLFIVSENTQTLSRDSILSSASATTAGVVTAGPTIRGTGLSSRAWNDNGVVHVCGVHAVTFFPWRSLLRFGPADATTGVLALTCVGRLLVGRSNGLPTRNHLPTVEQDEDDDRIWRAPGITREMRSATPGAPTFSETGIQIITLDFDSADAYLTCEYGRDMVIGGACPLRYDGDAVAELGFHTAPDDIAALTETTITPGGLTASSLYTYMACYEGTDAAGEVHQGPMSVPFQITLTAAGTGVTIPALPTYRLTGWRNLRIAIFRGVHNSTLGADGSVPDMWRITSLDPSATSGDNRYIANDTTIDTVSFHDNMSDLVLLTKEPAYTNAGALSNDPIGLGHLVLAAKGRLFFNDPTDGEIVRYTQQRRDGYGADVVGDLSIRVPGGAVRALAVLDDAILAFAAHQISFFAGDGPLPNPDAAPQIAFSPPRVVTGDVGCSSPRSMAITPDRVLFDSDRGIYEINRSQQISYIGAPVELYNASTVLSADPVPGKTQVIFLLDHVDSIALLYDYYFGEWSLFTNHGGLDGVVVGDHYHYLRANTADGRVFRQSTGYLDAGLDVSMLIRLAWIKPQGYHQGHVRFWYSKILGEYMSSHKLRVRFAVDYQPGWDAPYDLDVDANHTTALYGEGGFGDDAFGGASPSDSRYDEQIFVGVEAQALSVEISDIANGSPLGASFELTELILTGCILRPTQLAAASRSH